MKRRVAVLCLLLTAGVLFAQSLPPGFKQELESKNFFIKASYSNSSYWTLPSPYDKRNLQFEITTANLPARSGYLPHQVFSFIPVTGTNAYAIKNGYGFIVDVGGKSALTPAETVQKKAGKDFKMKKDNDAEIQTWDLSNNGVAEWQMWQIVMLDSYRFKFVNVFTKKAIDIQGSDVNKNGAKLLSYTVGDKNDQVFELVYTSGSQKGQTLGKPRAAPPAREAPPPPRR